jgi:hypothetical protein
MPKALDLTNQIFTRLTAIRVIGKNKAGQYIWLCRCECGTEKPVTATSLIERDAKSCGCLRIENRFKHGHGTKKTRKGSEYSSWEHMRARCRNPKHKHYSYYGGRGIKVCERWDSFINFLADMGSKPTKAHSLDRKDPNGNYEPSNCRWATRKEQALNQRRNAS